MNGVFRGALFGVLLVTIFWIAVGLGALAFLGIMP